MARGAKKERRAERPNAHQRAHSRAAADGHHANMTSRTKSPHGDVHTGAAGGALKRTSQ
jgi:hypothetical protein